MFLRFFKEGMDVCSSYSLVVAVGNLTRFRLLCSCGLYTSFLVRVCLGFSFLGEPLGGMDFAQTEFSKE